jgi:hypothetical protein
MLFAATHALEKRRLPLPLPRNRQVSPALFLRPSVRLPLSSDGTPTRNNTALSLPLLLAPLPSLPNATRLKVPRQPPLARLYHRLHLPSLPPLLRTKTSTAERSHGRKFPRRSSHLLPLPPPPLLSLVPLIRLTSSPQPRLPNLLTSRHTKSRHPRLLKSQLPHRLHLHLYASFPLLKPSRLGNLAAKLSLP